MAACPAVHLLRSLAIQSNLELKTQPKQLLGSLPLDITLPKLWLIWYNYQQQSVFQSWNVCVFISSLFMSMNAMMRESVKNLSSK